VLQGAIFSLTAIALSSGKAFSAGGLEPATSLQAKLKSLVVRARPGTFGISVIDLDSGRQWGVNNDRPFPMMSVFKAPVAATVLAMVDRGKISLNQKLTIDRDDLRKGASQIARAFRGHDMTFSVRDLLQAAVSHSDNTAADALIRLIGGPQRVTNFLRSYGIEDMRVDLDERGVEHVFSSLGLAKKPPRNETNKDRDARLWRGYQAFMDDPRNRSTPDAAANFLRKLWNGQLLSKTSTDQLLALMHEQMKPIRLRAGIPHDARLADKCGTSVTMRGVTAAFNDIGIISWPDGRAVIIAAFLTGSKASRHERAQLFADLANAITVSQL
jgi:beta-lactamase class A